MSLEQSHKDGLCQQNEKCFLGGECGDTLGLSPHFSSQCAKEPGAPLEKVPHWHQVLISVNILDFG